MQNLYNDIFLRNYGVINQQEQALLANAKITIVGAGGVGGITLISLARMGFGHIHVIDMDIFEHSNINRQMLSGVSRTGKSKALCAEETLKDINPNIQVRVTQEKLVEENAEQLFAGSNVIVDATDNLLSRVIIHRASQRMHIPSVWIAVTPPFRGGVMTFSHETPPYEVVLRHPSYEKLLTPEVIQEITQIKNERAKNSVAFGALSEWSDAFVEGKAPWAVLCPVANIVGILASFEVFKVVLNRPNLAPTYAPKLVKINLADTHMVTVQEPENGSWDNAFL
ncbi:MAG: ThiF family adenylyltransferase [Gammaproteobacteria bacterium]|nr:ThiF family adenylyltransferase [Gammaproteobacteria bacterium]